MRVLRGGSHASKFLVRQQQQQRECALLLVRSRRIIIRKPASGSSRRHNSTTPKAAILNDEAATAAIADGALLQGSHSESLGEIVRHGPGDACITLNVGGKEFFTLRSTVNGNAVLADHVARAEANQEVTMNGAVFIDRDPEHFCFVLNHLRNRMELTTSRHFDNKSMKQKSLTVSTFSAAHVELPTDPRVQRELYVEAAFYRIPELQSALCKSSMFTSLASVLNKSGGNPFDVATKLLARLRNVAFAWALPVEFRKAAPEESEAADRTAAATDEKSTKRRRDPPPTSTAAAACVSKTNQSGGSAGMQFRVATWNVWFGPTGDASPHVEPRMRALTRLLQEQHSPPHHPLWCIGLQEVVESSARYLVPALESAGYHVMRQPGHGSGCALAVHASLTILEEAWQPYTNTVMKRGFLYARVQLPEGGDQLIFTTTHLASYYGPADTGAAQRPAQLRAMAAFVQSRMQQQQSRSAVKAAILTGDLNWDDERVRSVGFDPELLSLLDGGEWQDSWLATKASSKDVCYTYDGMLNPMLGGKLRRRLDRILVHGRAAVPTAHQLLGTEAIPGLFWFRYNMYTKKSKEMPTAPSDHFGYLASIRLD